MVRITVAAHPGARAERVVLLDDDTLGVWVRARPVEGQANAAIEIAIASALGLRSRQVQLVAGAKSRRKVAFIDLPHLEALQTRLHAYGGRSD
jgi:uncharacterized protein YggU (UPF0235/DUF167 family)